MESLQEYLTIAAVDFILQEVCKEISSKPYVQMLREILQLNLCKHYGSQRDHSSNVCRVLVDVQGENAKFRKHHVLATFFSMNFRSIVQIPRTRSGVKLVSWRITVFPSGCHSSCVKLKCK